MAEFDVPPESGSAAAEPRPHPAATVGLLGMVALTELLGFSRMAADAEFAPELSLRVAVAELAAGAVANHRRVADRLVALGGVPHEAMAPFVGMLQAYDSRVRARDWHEALVRAYVGGAFTDDLGRALADRVAGHDADVIREVLVAGRYSDFAARGLGPVVAADPALVGSLSMWARRVVGEAVVLAVRVVGVVTPGGGGVPDLVKRLTAAHTARMTAVGLNN